MALEVYSTDKPNVQNLTCFIYGASRIGKTSFAATFPKPVFLVAGIEGNEATLNSYPGIEIIKIKSTKDMDEAIRELQVNPRYKACRTIVIDSLTFYCDMWISEVIRKKSEMGIQDWQKIDVHVMKYLVPTFHSMNKHIVWIALEQDLRRGDTVIGYTPMLYGKAPQKVPATTNLIGHMAKKVIREEGQPPKKMHVLELESTECTPIGSRYGQDMPEEFIKPHFNEIAKRIGKYIGEEVQEKK